jgi:hypothetical protein
MSPDEDLNKQIQHKFIRPTYRPFQEKPTSSFQRKIDIDQNGLPTYRVERNTQKTNIAEVSTPPLNYTPQHDVVNHLPNQQELIQNREQMLRQIPITELYNSQPPITERPSNKYHNCCDLYHQVQSCPVCKNVYTKNDGIYITVIVILLVIILFLLKKIFI